MPSMKTAASWFSLPGDGADSILFDIVIEDVTCNGEANGSICVENATGGTGALSFQVDPPGAAFNSTRALT